MELYQIFTPLRKWWWLIVVSTALAATVSYFVSREQPKFYQAKATLFAGRTVLDPNPTSADLYLGQQLALVYTAIAQQNPIISSTIEALGLNELPEYSVRTLPNSQFIEILVTDSIPERAVAVANEMATQLIAQSPGGVEDDGESRRLFITEQLNYLEVKIKRTQEDISAAQLILADLDSARDIDEAQATLLALQEKLVTLQATYASLIASAQSTGSNVLTIIEFATTAVPVGLEIWLLVFVATALGGSLSIGATYLIERMDDTLKLSDDIASVLDTKVLGYIPRTKKLKTHTEDGNTPYVLKNPLSPATEAFHQLRVNLDLSWGDEAPKTILVTSMGIGNGKTTVALNLATSFVLTGRKILLVDADFRHPEIHKRLGLPDGPGLSDAVKHDLSIDKVIHTMEDSRFTVVTNGSDTVDPVVFISSLKFMRELAQFNMESDLVILDSPPLLVSDALIMASKVDAVLIVLQPGRVSEIAATQMMDQLRRSKAMVLGVVLNQVPASRILRYFDERVDDIPLAVDDEAASPEKETKQKAKKPKKKVSSFKEDEENTKS